MTARPLPRAVLALALLAAAPPVAAQPPSVSRPNVLLISIDDLNDWVGGLGGHAQARTPNIDALARRGTLFTNAHCQAPVCTPSRASLVTGRLPSSTGMYFLQPRLARVPALRETPTLVERFAREGWRTIGGGKIYHGDDRRYFQSYGGTMGGFGPRPERKLAHPEGHPLWDWGAFPSSDDEMPDAKLALWASARLRDLPPDGEPFFLAVGFWRPHVPMYVPQRWFDLHPREDVALPLVADDDRADLSDYARLLTDGLPAPRHDWFVENGQWQHAVQAYLASTTFVDHCVGRVLDALAGSAHAKDTIVVLLSDHGWHLGEKQRWAKRSLWEDATRVPLIVAAPGFAPGVCREPVGLVDVYPTLLELCRLAADPQHDGASFVAQLRDPGAVRARPAITTFGPGNHAVRSLRWRYIRYRDGSEELYDHGEDPHEWRNLAGEERHAGVVARHRAWLPETDAEVLPGAEKSSGHAAFVAAERHRTSDGK